MINYWKEIQMEDPYVEIRLESSQENRDHVLLHSHSFYEILLCKSGNLHYFLDNKRFHLQPGDILLIPPGISHRPLYLEPMTEPYDRYVIWISTDFWTNCIRQFPDVNFAFEQCQIRDNYLLRSSRATWSGLFSAATSALKELDEKKLGWQSCLHSTILMLMTHIGRTYYYQDIRLPASEKADFMDDVFRYIDEHMRERLTLAQVAEHFLVSKSTISHTFQKHFSVSFHHCVIQRRLIAAKIKILSGTPLKSIWEVCGFADYSSFYRAFKKEYGISPQEFRQIHKNKKRGQTEFEEIET